MESGKWTVVGLGGISNGVISTGSIVLNKVVSTLKVNQDDLMMHSSLA